MFYRMKKFFCECLVLFSVLMSCQKRDISPEIILEDVFYAQIEQETQTKTVMGEYNNILWCEGDQVVIFVKNTSGRKYQVASESVGKASVRFDKIEDGVSQDPGAALDHHIAYYPYGDNVKCSKSGEDYALDVILPADQEYVPYSFADDSFPMVAISQNNCITFKNVCGGMKLYLKGTHKVSTIRVEGNDGEKLSGNATVTAYSSGAKPKVEMASDAMDYVILNCGSGVQLNESKATEFIISLPPVEFTKGFTVNVTDVDGQVYDFRTSASNSVLRSSLLIMPPVKTGHNDIEEPEEDDVTVPVSEIKLNTTFAKLYVGDKMKLDAIVWPVDASTKKVEWTSTNENIATVDEEGNVTAISKGTVRIFAVAGDVSKSCSLEVSVRATATIDYIDEYGINHGKGTAIGDLVWAPVNCGYHKDDFAYGKLYQWGRKYGQGYSGPLFVDGEESGTYSDAIIPVIQNGGVSLEVGQSLDNSNVFYIITPESNYDWVIPGNKKMWNAGGESNPVKAEYDPCPKGWRVPTYYELYWLSTNHSSWTTNESGQEGYYFSELTPYSSSAPQVFLPAAGWRDRKTGEADLRGFYGKYFASIDHCGYYELNFNNQYREYVQMDPGGKAYGIAVRCVQE